MIEAPDERLSRFHCLDVSELEPPEPLEAALEAVENYQAGRPICMRHRREPCALFPLLSDQNFSVRTYERREDFFEVVIWRTGDEAALAVISAAGYPL
jgi:hypothetical protein